MNWLPITNKEQALLERFLKIAGIKYVNQGSPDDFYMCVEGSAYDRESEEG